MTQRRIIYVLEHFPFPSGGVANIYRHVEILKAKGFAAYVALPRTPPVDFYGTTAPMLLHGGRPQPQAGDIWVIPEALTAYVKALAGAPVKRLMFCQNQYYLPFPARPGPGIAEFGVDGIVVCSQAVRKFFADVYGVPDLPILPCAVDPARFAPARTKRRQVAFMPLKLPADGPFIEAMLKRLYPRHGDIPWVAIKGVTQAAAARTLGESAVFLSLSCRESFGLPPLEAMASGCLVAGYHGDGGREYMTEQNGWWADMGDWRTCVDGLAAAFDLLDRGGEPLDAHRRAMAETVARYSPQNLEETLVAFWRQELAQPFA
jgi:glycosyltransferase involved in cell wall biosynthesis